MNKFYKLPKWMQWVIALLMMAVFLLIFLIWMFFINQSGLHYLWVFFIVPLLQFLATPFFTKLKVYQYLSPMLLVYSANEKRYDLHNGTSFDYLMVMKNIKPGALWQKKMLMYYVQGILEIISRIENNTLPKSVTVRGSSYFFSESTARRMGFKTSKTGLFEKFNLVLNYLDLLCFYSLAKGKLVFPNLFKIKTASITGEDLLKNKDYLNKLMNYLSKSKV